MVDDNRAFSSFAVGDLSAAKAFGHIGWFADPAGNILAVLRG